MADPRFFSNAGPFPLQALADKVGATLHGCDGSIQIHDVAPIDTAAEKTVTFLTNPKYFSHLKESNAAACIIDPTLAKKSEATVPLLITQNPHYAYAVIARMFYPEHQPEAFTAPTASIAPSASIGKNCRIEHGAVIEENVRLGDECVIGANSVIRKGCTIGDRAYIHNNVSISYAELGTDVIIHNGARIGQDGFGFATHQGKHVLIPQLGRVIIGNGVNIGANTTIDRGAGPDTVIGDGTQIDNLVQLGHNVRIGKGCVIVAQVGIAGSTRVDDYVVIGGQVGIAGHLHIGSGVQIAAQSGIINNVTPGEKLAGTPAVPIIQHHKQAIFLRNAVKGKKKENP
jgi:UDP-3-O-[3-hydroxymyristoyl] glucosamine N-acyltransferase